MRNFTRKFTVLLVAFAIVFGALGTPTANVAQASGSSSASPQISEEQLIKLLTQLIAMLQEQLQILQQRSGLPSDDKGSDDVGLTEAEAEIFTNETVVKIELNGKKSLFTTQLTSKEDLVEEIANRYDVSETVIDGILTIEEEDRVSRDSDKDWADDDDDGGDDEDEDEDDEEEEDD